jgi:hypothetical protein
MIRKVSEIIRTILYISVVNITIFSSILNRGYPHNFESCTDTWSALISFKN